MSETRRFLALDLGAESGRAIVGRLAEGAIQLEVIHRFPTEGIVMLGARQWDVTRIYGEILQALRKCAEACGPHLDGIAVDTWGVDFALIAPDGTLLANPVHYRDRRTEGMYEKAFARVPREEIYRGTGIQFMDINTLYQLLSMVLNDSPVLKAADSLLMMNDLFTYLLSGERSCEYTNATTTQLLDPVKKTWNDDLIRRLGFPRHLFLEPSLPGTVVGKILPEVAVATGISPDVPIILTAGHDTADAVAAVPALEGERGDWAYLSSGTWSLMGVELDAPVVNDETYAAGLTNEGGVCGTITFLKNIAGLWLVQECRRVWQRQGKDLSYGELTEEAARAEPFGALIDVNDPSFIAPDDMPAAIQDLCRKGGCDAPSGRGAILRCALESLALKYRRTLRDIDRILGRRTARLHIIGGGAQNRLLNQMAADACGVPVLAGPVEATSLGNIAVQAMAVGAIESLAEARRTISRSAQVERFEPADTARWDKADADFARRTRA